MSLDKETVKKIAYLARIRVPEDALDGLAAELNRIIGWVEQLNEVDTEGVQPMASVVDITLPERADTVDDGGIAEALLSNAPEPASARDDAGGFFTVPKVVE